MFGRLVLETLAVPKERGELVDCPPCTPQDNSVRARGLSKCLFS